MLTDYPEPYHEYYECTYGSDSQGDKVDVGREIRESGDEVGGEIVKKPIE